MTASPTTWQQPVAVIIQLGSIERISSNKTMLSVHSMDWQAEILNPSLYEHFATAFTSMIFNISLNENSLIYFLIATSNSHQLSNL